MRSGRPIKKTGAWIAFLIILTGTALPSIGRAQAVTSEMLLEKLQSEHWLEIDTVLNEIKKQGSQGKVVFVLWDIWNKDKEKYPRLNWGLIETQFIQLDIVDVLIQASRHGAIDIDEEPLREFVLGSLNSSNKMAVTLAVSILGFMGSDDDVDVISEVAKRFDEGPFRAAVAELTVMCGERAATALDELERQIEREDRILYLNYLRETRSRLQDYRDRKCKYLNSIRAVAEYLIGRGPLTARSSRSGHGALVAASRR